MYVYLAIAILSAALSGAGVWKVNEWRHAAIDKERIEQANEKRRMDAKGVDDAAVGHERDKTKMKTEFLVITERINVITQTTPFYAAPDAALCLDPDGLQQLAQAARGADATGEPAREVPRR